MAVKYTTNIHNSIYEEHIDEFISFINSSWTFEYRATRIINSKNKYEAILVERRRTGEGPLIIYRHNADDQLGFPPELEKLVNAFARYVRDQQDPVLALVKRKLIQDKRHEKKLAKAKKAFGF